MWFAIEVWYLARHPFNYARVIMWHKRIEAFNLDHADTLRFEIASEEDINQGDFEDIWNTREQALEGFRKGHLLFLAKYKTGVAFYGRIELLNISEPLLGVDEIRIPEDVGYISGLYTPPKYRGRLLIFRASKLSEKYLLEHTKVRKLFGVTAADNADMKRISRLRGYVPYQYVIYLRILRIKIYIVTPPERSPLGLVKIFFNNSSFWNAYSTLLQKQKTGANG
jgi:hypothetical protein